MSAGLLCRWTISLYDDADDIITSQLFNVAAKKSIGTSLLLRCRLFLDLANTSTSDTLKNSLTNTNLAPFCLVLISYCNFVNM